MKKLLSFILEVLAKRYIKHYQPEIVAITGNVGKTSTKEAIGAILSRSKKIRVSAGNLNNELGVPLTILGDWTEQYYRQGSSFAFWLNVLWQGLLGLFRKEEYPEILILEYAADKPGDIRRLARKFKPHVAVVTEISEIPVHIEFFGSAEAVAKEKARIVEVLSPADFAVLNKDDDWVWLMKDRTQANVLTYGFSEHTDMRVSDFNFRTDGTAPLGVEFALHHGEKSISVQINGSLGKSQAWSSAAAAIVALIYGLDFEALPEALSRYRTPNGRLHILNGIKNSWIIDDTYNASPASTRLALETLKDLPAKRKIAVLGDMLELGEYTEPVHREIGALAGEVVDVLVCVGPRAKFIADSASSHLAPDKIFTFLTSNNAKFKVQELIQEHDLILVKGSQSMRMEYVVEEIMAEPENKERLLIRQSDRWRNK